MKDVKVLGPGCANCQRLAAMVQKVSDAEGVAASVEKVTDYAEIMRYGVMRTPGLVVDGQLVVSGRLPSEEEIRGWLAS